MRINTNFQCRAMWTVAAFMTLSTAAPAADPTLTGPYAAIYAEAHHLVTNERVVEGTEMLAHFLREAPAGDVVITQQVMGHAQLLAFAYQRLMSQAEQRAFARDVLVVKQVLPTLFVRSESEYPSDRLFNAAVSLGSQYKMEREIALQETARLADGGHDALSVAAIYLVGASRGFSAEATNTTAGRALVMVFPGLELTRTAIEWPVIEAMTLARNPSRSYAYRHESASRLDMDMRSSRSARQPGRNRFLLEEIQYWDGNHRQAYAISPGLAAAAEILPSMHTQDLNDAVFAGWAERVADESDWRVRHTLVALLGAGVAYDTERTAALHGLEAVAFRPAETADVLRAQLALVHLALDAHDADAAQAAVSRLLSNGLLPVSGDFLAYEATLLTARRAARYFTDYGHYRFAIQTHEQLAAKYPETPPSRGERERAERLRREPQTATLERLDSETHSMLSSAQSSIDNRGGRHDYFLTRATQRLEDIVERTPDGGLRAALIMRLDRLQARPLPIEFFRPKREPFTLERLRELGERQGLVD